MNRYLKHLALPALAPAAIVGLYLTPVEVFGCATRGLMALGVVLLATIGAFVAIGLALRLRRRGEPGHDWWLLSALILTLSLVLLLGPLG